MKKIFLSLSLATLALAVPSPAHAAKMALSPAGGELKTGCPTAISIVVNTEGENSMAADAFLRYNPDQIEMVDQMSGVAGTQLRPGSVYESYPGNFAKEGLIRLTAFNREGYFNGRGVLGSMVIKGKPGVELAEIWFEFYPGSTTDSNVANIDANDILNASYGGSYRFSTGSCGGDASPPWVEDPKPGNGDYGVPLDSDIQFSMRDNLSGVDLDTLKVWVNDTEYSLNGEHHFSYSGKPNRYEIQIRPIRNFLEQEPVVVKVDAQDLAKNAMQQFRYAFNELVPVAACAKPVALETVRPAAPEARGITSGWPWWFVLFCSLILNLHLLNRRQRQKHEKLFPATFEKKRIRLAEKTAQKPIPRRRR